MFGSTRKSAWLIAAGLMSSASASAEHTPPHCEPPCHPVPYGRPAAMPPYATVPPGTMTAPADPAPNGQPAVSPESDQDAFQNLLSASSSSSSYSGNIIAPGVGLTSVTTANTAGAAGGGQVFTFDTTVTSSSALILPGLFTAVTTQSAWPVNRLSVDYGYFDGIEARSAGATTDFNLHSYSISGEYALIQDTASFYFRVPFLSDSRNTTGQDLNGVGDVSLGLKYALYADRLSGDAFSVGLTVALPTAPDLVATTNRYQYADPTQAGNTVLPATRREKINPTFWQPYVSGVTALGDLAVSSYAGVLIPDDDRVATLGNFSLGLSYALYRNDGALLSSVTPSLTAQALVPFNNRGSDTVTGPTVRRPATGVYPANTVVLPPFNTPDVKLRADDQLFLAPGVSFGIGQSAQFSVSAIIPVSGPKGFNTGFTAGLTWYY